MYRALVLLILASGTTCAALAEDAPPAPPTTSKHQMMKECMAKQVASEGGMPKEEMKKACKNVTQTEHDNEKAEKHEESGEKPAGTPPN
jgi:hypothetical protein